MRVVVAKLFLITTVLAAAVPASAGAAVSLSANPESVTTDERVPAAVTLTVRNSGPYGIQRLQVSVAPAGLVRSGTPSAGTFSRSSALWEVPEVAAGDTVTLRVSIVVNRAPMIGAVEMFAGGGYEGALIPSEDGSPSTVRKQEILSRIPMTINVRPGLPSPYVTINVSPLNDSTPPFAFTIKGRVVAFARDRRRGWCTGTVRVSLFTRQELDDRVDVKELVGASSGLSLRGTTCRFKTQRLVVRDRAGLNGFPSLQARARFSGNSKLRGVASPPQLVIVVR